MNDAQLQKEINDAIAAIRGVSKSAGRSVKRALTIASAPLIDEIQSRAPVSDAVHYRYDTPKAAKNIRAPKGSGRIKASYAPGNLERSFDVLRLRRTKNAVIVGPEYDKSGSGGNFTGERTDGYYAWWQEFGAPNAGIVPRPFIGPARQAVGGEVRKIAAEELKKAIERYAKSVAK